MEKEIYSSPEVEVISIKVEKGFATSGDSSNIQPWSTGNEEFM